MKIVMLIILLALTGSAYADQSVRGYFKKDGTYVQPHYRSSPNNSTYDNYSSQGNTNPYTGDKGYRSYDYNSPGYGSGSRRGDTYRPYNPYSYDD